MRHLHGGMDRPPKACTTSRSNKKSATPLPVGASQSVKIMTKICERSVPFIYYDYFVAKQSFCQVASSAGSASV